MPVTPSSSSTLVFACGISGSVWHLDFSRNRALISLMCKLNLSHPRVRSRPPWHMQPTIFHQLLSPAIRQWFLTVERTTCSDSIESVVLKLSRSLVRTQSTESGVLERGNIQDSGPWGPLSYATTLATWRHQWTVFILSEFSQFYLVTCHPLVYHKVHQTHQ